MGTRLELQALLEVLLGSRNVYYQEPQNVKMQYPAIVYHLSDIQTRHASNLPYQQTNQYLVTVIDRDVDSAIRDKVKRLPLSSFERAFVVDKLHHFNFNLFY